MIFPRYSRHLEKDVLHSDKEVWDERGETRRKYDRAFKEGAVRLVIENGQTLTGTARDLGITENMLQRWKKEYLKIFISEIQFKHRHM